MQGKERKFTEGSTLISITDLSGVIQYCNKDFIQISGYSEQELVNANHHVVRHPDMPKAAFEDLWQTIKKDKPWQGIVKNLCKNGDYYWVDAYVTPVYESGKKVGYQSIRSCPTKKQVESAEKLYQELNQQPNKKIPKPGFFETLTLATKFNTLITLLFATFLLSEVQSGSLFETDLQHILVNVFFLGLYITILYLLHGNVFSRIDKLSIIIKNLSTGDLNSDIKIQGKDEISEAVISAKILQGRLKAVIGRFGESSQSLTIATDVLSEASYQTKLSMGHQHDETDLVATAMNEMSATVSEISQNTTRTSELATSADEAASKGQEMVGLTRKTILELSTDISDIHNTITVLAEECQQIRDITASISGIADQTNLLALNAAIEAARAGEQGKGFSVVADEVRVLSSRTQEATVEINSMIDQLQGGSSKAVLAMDKGLEKVKESVEQIKNTEESFSQIASSVVDLNDMNLQIATAANQQNDVTEEMNGNVHSISMQSNKTLSSVELLESKIKSLTEMSESLQIQLQQYDLGEAAAEFDFNQAKKAHLSWKLRVRNFLQGDINAISKEQVCSHRECDLGRWYYSEGMSKYKDSSYFKGIEKPHARLHQIIQEVFDMYEKGTLDEAEALYQELGPLSDEIVDLLDKTENSLR
jgi:aerotaxis receptor